MVIYDGYSRRLTLSEIGIRLIYRPAALAAERRRFRFESDYLNSTRFVSEWISRRIVGSDSEMTPFDLVRSLEDNEPVYRRLYLTVQGLLPDDSGKSFLEVQRRLADNLRTGVELELTNPRLAKRPCEECKKWWYDEKSGLVLLQADGSKLPRFGPTLCETAEGCGKGTPDQTRSLNKTNRWAWLHFQHCDAVNSFPDDPIVTRNALIIRRVMKVVEGRKKR